MNFKHQYTIKNGENNKKEPLDKKNNSKAKQKKSWVLTKQHKIALGVFILFSVVY
jgi:S-DNA-T family DNA segregation ATPase FtsK/SpoIIIE